MKERETDSPLLDPQKLSAHMQALTTQTQRDGQHFSDRPAVQRALARIFDFIGSRDFLQPGSQLLDIGLGGGQLAEVMQQRFGLRYHGITIDADELQRAGATGIRVRLADMHDLPYQDGTFDALWASHVLEHSPAPLVALREWHRVLRPGGRLLLWAPVGRDFHGKDDGTCVYGCRDHLLTPTTWQYRWLFELSSLGLVAELDAPYQLRNAEVERRYILRRELEGFLARFGLALMPRLSPGTATFFVLQRR